MAVYIENRVNALINDAMDGRTNKWLKDKLSEKGIVLTDVQISQRFAGATEWRGNEALACFEILKINVLEGVDK